MAAAETVPIVIREATIGDRFRLVRTAARLSLGEAARSLGLSKSVYQRVEAGTREPTAAEVIAFAAITGQSIEVFGPSFSDVGVEVLSAGPAALRA